MSSEPLQDALIFSSRTDEVAASLATKNLVHGPFRLRLAFAAFDISRQHHAAIALLVQSKRYDSSARSLLRPTIEASLKAEWLLLIAPETKLQLIAKHKDGAFDDIRRIAAELDKKLGNDFRKPALKMDEAHLHSFTHAGSQALVRHINGPLDAVGMLHDPLECAVVLLKAAFWVINAGLTLAATLNCREEGDAFYILSRLPKPSWSP